MLRANARLRVEIRDADVVAKALQPDDLEWCRCYAEEGRVVIVVETDRIGALLNAIDDYLVNLKAVKGLFDATSEFLR